MADDFPDGTPWWAKMFVSNVRDIWKWISTWFAGAIVLAPMVFEYVPEASEYLTQTQRHYLISVLGLLTILGRIVNQKPEAK